jgi:hypothetical protein
VAAYIIHIGDVREQLDELDDNTLVTLTPGDPATGAPDVLHVYAYPFLDQHPAGGDKAPRAPDFGSTAN